MKKILEEIAGYKNNEVEISEGFSFSAFSLIKRINLFRNKHYPTGKWDAQDNYKYYFDIISQRVNAEIKNIDFDTKDIVLHSEADADRMRNLFANTRLRQWMSETGESEKLNTAIERGTEWGSLVWKKTKDGYRVMDLNNLYVLNQTAETIHDSDVIEFEIMRATDLRKMELWKNVEELIKTTSKTKDKVSEFFIYERNGELSEKEFNDIKVELGETGKKNAKDNKYLLTKVIMGGVEKDKPNVVLYCEEIDEYPYKEYHRTSYTGRWLRVGIFELLLDIQVRANEIGNQIARGLEWASKTIFRSADVRIAQNILTDMQSGDIIKSADLAQVETRMQGLDQLMADWNRLMLLADSLANSHEVVMGITPPSGVPLGTTERVDINAGKLFDFIREKLGLTLQDVISDWILPVMLKDLRAKKILELTGSDTSLNVYYETLVNDWYVRNLIAFPPHTAEMAQELKQMKLQEFLKKKDVMITLEENMWKGYKPRVRVVITGENYALTAEIQDLVIFANLEQDPIRRSAILEIAAVKKGMDFSHLPKTPPRPIVAPVGAGVEGGQALPQRIQRTPQRQLPAEGL